MKNALTAFLAVLILSAAISLPAAAQIGKRFPSERKVVTDPVTGVELVFLTTGEAGDSKIYQTHNQWTADSQWLVFRSNRVKGEAMAVHEKNGDIVQITEGGYRGMLNVARKSMNLYLMRWAGKQEGDATMEIVRVDLGKLFADSEKGKLKGADAYQTVCGVIPAEMRGDGDMVLDADEEWAWFRVGREEAGRHLPEGTYDIEMDNDQVFITQKLEISNGKASIVAGSTESVLFPEILQAGGSVIVDTRLSNVANMSLEINDDATAFLKQDIVPGKIYRFVLQDFGKGAYDIKVAADGKYRTKTIYR